MLERSPRTVRSVGWRAFAMAVVALLALCLANLCAIRLRVVGLGAWSKYVLVENHAGALEWRS
jgi:hypothetical protein